MRSGKTSGTLSACIALAMVTGGVWTAASAADLQVTMHKVTADGVGEAIGTIGFRDEPDKGLMISPDLHGLTPGLHGFHVHEHPSCDHQAKEGKQVAGLAAGGHYDPGNTKRHEGPAGKGHLGDLPALPVDADGKSQMTLYASRLKVADLTGRAIMIHEGGDNYADDPKPLGGGGARVACGVVGAD